MNNYFAHLKLPFEYNYRPLATFKTNLGWLGHAMRTSDRIDPRLHELLKSKDMKITHCEAFYTPPRRVLPIHVDHDKLSDLVKLNFCYGGFGSKMQWWKPKNLEFEPIVKLTNIGTKYIHIPQDECDLVQSAEIKCTLVNVGQPHSIINGPQMRWVFSCVLWGLDLERDMTLQEARERLSDLVIE